jgi:long-chain fatty acid transport protein
MKNFYLIACAFLFLGSSQVLAQHDNLINSSAEWVRTPARNAATDASDIVIYNPAGLVRLTNGFHINVGNQSLFRKPTHTYDLGIGMGEKTSEQDGSDPLLPNIYLTYKKDKWALFTGMFIAGGGATANYPNGTLNTDLVGLQVLTAAQGAYMVADQQKLKASSMYLTTTLGTSFAASERISFAAAGRYLNATNKTEASMVFTQSPFGLPDSPFALKTEDNATGYGAVLSMMVKATPKFDFSVRYETAVKMNFETTTKQDDFGATVDGAKSRRDLPAVLALGTAWSPCSKVKVYGDMNYYFQKNADWSTSSMATNEEKYSAMAGDAATYSLATTFTASKKLLLSIGGSYTDFMYSNRDGYFTKLGAFETAPDDNFSLNTGFSYRATSSVTLTFAYLHAFYQDQEVKALLAQPLDVTVKTSNSADIVAIGLNLQF